VCTNAVPAPVIIRSVIGKQVPGDIILRAVKNQPFLSLGTFLGSFVADRSH